MFRLLLALVLVLGCLLRVSHLPNKTFGGDEVFSALRSAGSSFQQARLQLADGQAHPVAVWREQLAPITGSHALDTVKALAREAPEHPPLFFLASRLWQQHFGSDLASKRLLPALLGIALIPACAALAWELWHQRGISLLAATLVAVSPFHVLYAQELRQYSLWACLISLTTLLLLRAFRNNRPLDWVLYGASATILLYTHLFSVGLVLSFSALILLPTWRRYWRQLLGSTAGALLLFSPWLLAAAQGAMLKRGNNLWTIEDLPFGLLSWNWGLNLTRMWLDLDPGGRVVQGDGVIASLARLLAVLASGCGVALVFGWLFRHRDRRALSVLLALLAGSVLPLIAADLLLGGSRSAIARYPVAGYLAVQLAVAAALGNLWLHRRIAGTTLIALVLIVSLHSSHFLLQANSWWSKQGSIDQASAASTINAYKNPLIVAEGYIPRLLSLSTLLRDDAELMILENSRQASSIINATSRPLILYRPSNTMLATINKDTDLEILLQTPSRYPYLPSVDNHTRIQLTRVKPQKP